MKEREINPRPGIVVCRCSRNGEIIRANIDGYLNWNIRVQNFGRMMRKGDKKKNARKSD